MRKGVRIGLQVGGLYLLFGVGNLLQQIGHLPIPGSIMGLFLLFFLLITGIVPEAWLAGGADWLLKVLPFLFLPSFIGVMNYRSFFIHQGVLLAGVVFVNTLLVMVVSAWVGTRIARRKEEA
jgi:holin-like protein